MSKTERNISKALVELTGSLSDAARDLVPWFLEQMPESYFEDLDATTRLEHLGAILALRAVGQEPRLRIKSADGRRITHILPEDAPGTLTRLMRDFSEGTIRAAKIYSCATGASSSTSSTSAAARPATWTCPTCARSICRRWRSASCGWTRTGTRCGRRPTSSTTSPGLTEDYVRACSPERILSHADLCRRVRRHTAAVVQLEEEDSRADRSRLVIACANVSSTSLFLRVANRTEHAVHRRHPRLRRHHVRRRRRAGGHHLGPGRWNGRPADRRGVAAVAAAARRPAAPGVAGRRDPGARLPRAGAGSGRRGFADDLRGAGPPAAGQEQPLPLHPVAHRRRAARPPAAGDRAARICSVARFDPQQPLSEQAYQDGEHRLARAIEERVDDEAAATVLRTVLQAIGATLKTNYFVPGRFALALRLAPALFARSGDDTGDGLFGGVLGTRARSSTPFTCAFATPRAAACGWCVRASTEQHLRESERHLDEAYALAHAQELKNKDIPEGGAKAVLLVHPARDVTPCVRAFTDAMLDLITADPATRARVVDLLRCARVDLIRSRREHHAGAHQLDRRARPRPWLRHPERAHELEARRRHQPQAVRRDQRGRERVPGGGAAGHRHRSARATVHVEVDRRPRRRRGWQRDQDRHPRVRPPRSGSSGVADGLGCAEDPRGLAHVELLRLVAEDRPIVAFDPNLLVGRGAGHRRHRSRGHARAQRPAQPGSVRRVRARRAAARRPSTAATGAASCAPTAGREPPDRRGRATCS